MDKASVLGDAIKYLKQLQERVKTLEDQTRRKSTESVAFANKSCSDDHAADIPVEGPLPEIEVRISDKDILIRIHCEKQKGIIEKTLSELEKFQLSIINSTALTFGTSTLDITIIAQVTWQCKNSVHLYYFQVLHSLLTCKLCIAKLQFIIYRGTHEIMSCKIAD